MKPSPIRGIPFLACAVVIAAAGCSSGRSAIGPASTVVPSSGVPTPSTTAPRPAVTSNVERTPKETAERAVIALLEAEMVGDHTTSFALLSSASLASYPDAEAWARRRRDTAAPTKFTTETVNGVDITLLVEHTPTIDPFVGLQFAQERQTWKASNESGGWLVEPDPLVAPIIPAATGASDTALKWAIARQACDEAGTLALQAVSNLFGLSAGAPALCGATGTVAVGAVISASPGPQTAALVAQYGSDVLAYVRAVPVQGVAQPFVLLLVPIGEEWRVVAASD